MDYSYDIFISYQRHATWTPWLREHINYLLNAYLFQDLGQNPHIFFDEAIAPGDDWPARLGQALGRARILVPIFSKGYFGSDWCLHELDLMHSRMVSLPGKCLIIPLLLHDGEHIPDEIARIQYCDIREFCITDIQRKSRLYERFSQTVKNVSPRIADAISDAPLFDQSWESNCRSRFDQVYQTHCQGGRSTASLTSFTLKSDVSSPIGLPRVTLQ